MFSFNNFTRRFYNGKSSPFSIRSSVSLPMFEVVSEKEGNSARSVDDHLKGRKSKSKRGMENESTVAEKRHVRVHHSGRKNRVHSRHEHKCGKEQRAQVPGGVRSSEHRLESRSRSEEILSPFEMNVSVAYQHLKNENERLRYDVDNLRDEKERARRTSEAVREENDRLQDDVSLMKNLVFKLNQELERYQTGEKKAGDPIARPSLKNLPENYDKSFLRPVVPLLKAYSESLQEKDDIIRDLEAEYKKFNAAFNDILHENEKLYAELERKIVMDHDESVFDEVKLLKRNLDMTKQENNLLSEQIKLEKEKLVKIYSVFKVKVEESSKEKEGIRSNMDECRSDLLVMKGKYAILKQEFDRLKMDNDTRVPLAVHSASINECRKLFQDLKNEYENEKCRLLSRMKDLEETLARQTKEEEKWTEERNLLEKSNFSQTFEIDNLRKKIVELEAQAFTSGKTVKQEPVELRKQLGEANRRVDNLSKDLLSTRKKLHKAMQFAEEIVRGQEKLLMQLHEKQKENNYMTVQFGNLKNQLKDVERGAQEGLNSVEEKIRSLESENQSLLLRNRKLEKLLMETNSKTVLDDRPSTDSVS